MNILTAMAENENVVKKERDAERKAVALAWLFHLVGDIHQPLHTAQLSGFVKSQLTELLSTNADAWAKESFEIATKIAYRNGGLVGSPKGGNKDCRDVQAASLLPVGYVVSARRVADRRMILAGYRLADLLTRVVGS